METDLAPLKLSRRLAHLSPGSIFFRIFAWFLLAMALVVITLLTLTVTTQSGPIFGMWRHEIDNALTLYGRTAVEIYQEEGAEALKRSLADLQSGLHGRIFILDGAGNAILGGTPPDSVRGLLLKSAESGRLEFQFTDDTFLAGRFFSSLDGKRYAVVREAPKGALQALFGQLQALGWKLIIFFIMGGTLCYWLARHLAAPILKLQGAARKLAAGDLSFRVSQAIGSRPYEIAALGEDFDLMAARIEVLLQAQRRMLRDISHELRSPLARLSVALELARQRSSLEAAAFLDRIEREMERLKQLIGQLLAVERLEAEVGTGEKEVLDLAELARKIALDADFEAQSRNCSVEIVQTEPLHVSGVKELLRSALENVVRNALRHTREGSAIEITLSREEEDGMPYAAVAIRDHGPGVPEEALAQLFRPFYRVGEGRERDSGGTGLGLTITDRAVSQHAGSVAARNAPDGGLVIEIRLPLVN